ncbi:hypothetical protein AWB78_02376 [Caballeronia calidae]|uniref:DUF7673 domain-containing protein n=1 Tax=Caballeronia calidae TaxID=1777139 RepID=A0A158B7F0_9BURK|nr:hypothetical protein [Caballeronia calidae]SAK66008.1 hypothetical protein AWB78_02376 [Caballeronia calidae]
MELPGLLPKFERDMGALATHRLLANCLERDGQAAASLADFLLSLYDARVAKLDAYILCRCIEAEHFEDVLFVMRWFRFAENGFDIHHVFGYERGTALMRALMQKFRTGYDK